MLPLGVKKVAKKIADEAARAVFAFRLGMKTMTPPEGSVALSFAGALPLSADEIIHGGRVKLSHLAEQFPESADFNIVYMVSSAIPDRAEEIITWARRNGAKLVWNQNGVGYPAWAGADYERFNVRMKKLISKADFVVYQSEFCKESADIYLGTPDAPWRIIYNCVDTNVFRPPSIQRPSGTWRMLAAGTHNSGYRVLDSIRALAELKKAGRAAELMVAGNLAWPRAREEAGDLASALGVAERVRFHPPYTQREAPALYAWAHVLLHFTYNDSCPTVPMEAMACGAPVIGSKSGGMPEIVGEDGGALLDVPKSWEKIHSPDPVTAAHAVERIMGRWSEHSAAARGRAEKMFGKREWMERHRGIFRDLLGIEP